MTASPTATSGTLDAHDLPRDVASRWPDLAAVPGSPLRSAAAEALFRHAVKKLPVTVRYPDGSQIGAGGATSPQMRLRQPARFFGRVGSRGKVGFGESYMAAEWTCEDLAGFLTAFAAEPAAVVPLALQRAGRRLVALRRPHDEDNDLAGARSNISRHYDLSNDLFAAFLDETMTYSSALFGPGDDLAAAQRRKIDAVLDAAGVTAGTTVVEIGTGWGQLAIQAATRGARITTVTLSEEQARLARERALEAGVGDRIDIELRDYRQVTGTYDAVVSVEMIEAVGRRHWPTYFGTLDRLLKPGGSVGLQAITMPHHGMLAMDAQQTWITKYIFPGGIIPSVRAIEQHVRDHTGLRIAARRSFGQDYARTLASWRERFLARQDEVAALGFDEAFRRMWEFYLAYCEAGFRGDYLDVHQFSLHQRG